MKFQELIVSVEVTNIDTKIKQVNLLEIAKQYPKGDLHESLQKKFPHSRIKIIDMNWIVNNWL